MVAPGAPIAGTRITLCLPVNDPAERAAAGQVISVLTQRYGGCTHSSLQPPVFRGYWDDGTRFVSDRVIFLFVDVQRELGDSAFLQELEGLRVAACGAYDDAGRHQDAIWLVAHPILGVVDPCPPPVLP